MRQLVKHLFTVNGERCHDVVQEKVFRRVQVAGGEAGRGGSELEQMVGRLTMENALLKKALARLEEQQLPSAASSKTR